MRKLICLALMILCGCSFVPFEKTEYVLISDVSPEDVIRRQALLTPVSFKIINTVVFQFKTRKFLSLGYLSVDANEKSFELVGMNPIGIKLIEIAVKDGEVITNNVIEEISKRGDVSKVLVKDIPRIYFDQIPSDVVQLRVGKKEIVFVQKDDSGKTEYVFAGKENHLINKTYYEGNKKIWSVEYYEYMSKDSKVYPKGIIYKNYLYKYKLTINTKEIL